MVGEIIALWFGSVHQLAMVWKQATSGFWCSRAKIFKTTTFALHDFCLYPYWVQQLRFELDKASEESTNVHPESLALLDSFVQESMRVTTSDASKADDALRQKASSDVQ